MTNIYLVFLDALVHLWFLPQLRGFFQHPSGEGVCVLRFGVLPVCFCSFDLRGGSLRVGAAALVGVSMLVEFVVVFCTRRLCSRYVAQRSARPAPFLVIDRTFWFGMTCS